MKCIECQGTGNLPNNPYREAPPMKQEEKPKKSRWYKRVDWTKWGMGAAIFAVLGAAAFGIYMLVAKVSRQDREYARSGIITAQYDDKGQVVRCWVNPRGSDTKVKLTDHSASMEVSDRLNIEGLIQSGKSLGIENMQMCDGAGR